MKTFNILASMAWLSATIAFAGSGSVEVQTEFSFVPGRDCSDGELDSSFCQATLPKLWADDEINQIHRWIAALPPRFLTRVQENGYRRILRYGHSFRRQSDGHYSRGEDIAWVWPNDLTINVSDLLFFDHMPLDPFSGYDFMQKTFVHELGHVFGDTKEQEEFAQIVGWHKNARGEWQLRQVNTMDVQNVWKSVQKTAEQGYAQVRAGQLEAGKKLLSDAMVLNRRYGMSHGFPTTYSMINPNECFAEFIAHFFLDQKMTDYVNPEILAWIKNHIDSNAQK